MHQTDVWDSSSSSTTVSLSSGSPAGRQLDREICHDSPLWPSPLHQHWKQEAGFLTPSHSVGGTQRCNLATRSLVVRGQLLNWPPGAAVFSDCTLWLPPGGSNVAQRPQ